MPSGISTYSDISAYVNTIFDDALFVARDIGLMLQLVNIKSAMGLAPRTIPKWDQATVTKGAEGVDYSGTATFDKTTAATITPQIAKTQYKFTQARYDTDPDDVQGGATREMGMAIGNQIDEDLVDLFPNATHSMGAAGSALTLTRCAGGMAKLRNANAQGPFYFVLHPYGWHDVWVELGQPATNQAFLGDKANEALRDYFVQRQINADWFVDGNIDVDGSDDAVSCVFNRDAFTFDSRKEPMMLVDFDASVLGGGAYELNLEVWYGVGTPRPEYACKLIHDAAAPSA